MKALVRNQTAILSLLLLILPYTSQTENKICRFLFITTESYQKIFTDRNGTIKEFKETLEKEGENPLNKNIGRPKKNFISYEKAQQLVIELGITTVRQFEKWSQSEKRPNNFPSNPSKTYNSKWRGWGEFLGTGRKLRQKKNFILTC